MRRLIVVAAAGAAAFLAIKALLPGKEDGDTNTVYVGLTNYGHWAHSLTQLTEINSALTFFATEAEALATLGIEQIQDFVDWANKLDLRKIGEVSARIYDSATFAQLQQEYPVQVRA